MATKVTFISATKTIKFNPGVRTIDFQTDVYSDGKEDWLVDSELFRFIFPVRSIGGNTVPGGKIIEPAFFLRNGWQMEPASEDHEVTIYGNVYHDNGIPIVKIPTGGYAIIVNLNTTTSPDTGDTSTIKRASESIIYGGGISVNTTSANTGTVYPVGTPSYPVNNIIDATTIATSRGFSMLYILSNLTLIATDNISNYVLDGLYHDKILITVTSGAVVTNVQFNNVSIAGDLGGNFCAMQDCSLADLTNVNSNVYRSELGGVITLSLGDNRHWIRCSTNKHTTVPTLDFQSTNQSLVLTGYTGNLRVINFTAGELTIYLDSGTVELTSTCIGGSIHVYGTRRDSTVIKGTN